MTEQYRNVVVDGRGHLLGRLASVVAKQLLEGQRVTVVRCEEIVIAGPMLRNRLRFQSWLNKHSNINRRHGSKHSRAAARIFWRTVRGMVPHKTPRGEAALQRLSAYEGVPPPYDHVKRMVVPAALRVLKVKPVRKVTNLGELSASVGWQHRKVVAALEDKRKRRSVATFARGAALRKLKAKAVQDSSSATAELNKVLAPYGY